MSRIPSPARPRARRRPRAVTGGLAIALAAGVAAPAALCAQQVRAGTEVSSAARPGGWLGIRLDGFAAPPAAPGAVDGTRMVVTDLHPGGPAESGGLRIGDVLVRLNGQPADLTTFRSVASRLLPGDPLALTVLRDGGMVDVSIRAGKGPDHAVLMPLEARAVQAQLDSVRTAFVQRLATVRARVPTDEARAMLTAVPEIHVSRAGRDSLVTVVVVTKPDGSVVRLREVGASGGAFAYRYTATEDSLHVRVRSVQPGTSVRLSPARAPRASDAAPADRAPGTASAVWRPLTPYLEGANRVAGAELRAVDQALGEFFGVTSGLLVTEVAEGTPARAAGLHSGDVVLQVDGVPVTRVAELRKALSERRAPVVLRVLRRGHSLHLTLPR